MDVLHALPRDAGSVIAVTVLMLWGAAVVAAWLRPYLPSGLGRDEIVALTSAAWIVPALTLGALALFMSALTHDARATRAVVVFAAAAAFSILLRPAHSALARDSTVAAIILGSLWIAMSLLRLGFVKAAFLPPYFDSAVHYELIRQLTDMTAPGAVPASLALPFPGYYHLAYHIMIAGLALLSGQDIASLMLAAGQLALAAVAVPLYGIVRRTTHSPLAGILACVLVAWGWYMPAHAVNWGKYPALLALLPLLAALYVGLLAHHPVPMPGSRRALLWFAVALAAVTALTHSRMLIVLGAAVGCWFLSERWATLTPRLRWIAVGILTGLGITLAGLALRDPVLGQALDPYRAQGATAAVGVLALLAVLRPSRIAFSALAWSAALLGGLFIPSPVQAAGTLLDRPLVSLLLPFPLAILGSVGFAHLAELLPRGGRGITRLAGAVAAVSIVVNGVVAYGVGPSDCCVIAGSDDLVAADWLAQHANAGDRVALAWSALRVAPETYPPIEAVSDAGIWVGAITRMRTSALEADTDFASDEGFEAVCAAGVNYVYAGSAPRSFSQASLQARADRYRIRLQLPAVALYEVIGCPRVESN